MLPPHGPPGPETQPQPLFVAVLSQLAPNGQAPPQAPVASLPHGVTQKAAGPGQHACSPPALTHKQACSQTPFTHRSAVQALSSPQSASAAHPGVGVSLASGMQPQLPSAARSQWPAKTTAGHANPGGHRGEKKHGPPHAALLHCGVGVAGGVGKTGTQLH